MAVQGNVFEVFRPTARCSLVVKPSVIQTVKALKKISMRTDNPSVLARFGNNKTNVKSCKIVGSYLSYLVRGRPLDPTISDITLEL